jgi:hypothetical protein
VITITDAVVKILAILGSGAGGALGMGLLARLLLPTMTLRKPPRWSILTVRLLGGGIGAGLAALWLFGGGGPGIGGTGGMGFGSGISQGSSAKTEEVGKKDDTILETLVDQTLRIEVLGNAALTEPDIQAKRHYRIETAEGPRLLTFAEIRAAIQKRQQEQPPLRCIELVLYKDSPHETVPLVHDLREWVSDRHGGKIKMDIVKRDAEAPRK